MLYCCIIIYCKSIIQVPAWCDDAERSLIQFNNDFPAFQYIGEKVHIAPDTPFDTDGDINVQLVCKYFRAKQTNQLDQWCHRKLYMIVTSYYAALFQVGTVTQCHIELEES